MPNLIPASSYTKLLKTLQAEIKQSLENIRRFADRQRVLTYWKIGKETPDFITKTGTPSAQLYERLSADTGIHIRTLQQCVQFAGIYPDIDPELPLTWSHYRYLMMVASSTERVRWQKRAIKEQWDGNELRRLIQQNRSAQFINPSSPSNNTNIPVRRGALHTYRIVKVSYTQDAPDGMMLDCGFEMRIPPPPANGQIDNTRIVESEKTPEGYRLKLSKTPVGNIYTYKAIVERIVDGDTLLVNIDCGFTLWIRQRLRLNRVDAPEVRTVAGDRAKAWLTEELGKCPFVVIKTYKTDKYDRYLVDVFYQPGASDPHVVAAEGTLLNAAMLNLGLAKFWQP